MSAIVKAESNSHWYLPDGTPFYETDYPDKSVAKAIKAWKALPEGERGARPKKRVSLREARPVQAKPSVTNIISVLDKPQLTSWKIEQAIIAAVTMPESIRTKFDDVNDLAKAIAKDAQEITSQAADFGTKVHDAIEHWVLNGVEPEDTKLVPTFELFAEWWSENIEDSFYVERVVNGHGYAGKVDAKVQVKDVGICIVDFKTRKSDKGKFAPYETDCMQLTAYREADSNMSHEDVGPVADSCMSLYIDSLEPRIPVMKVWDEDQADRYLKAFFAAQNLWCHIKDYDPRAS